MSLKIGANEPTTSQSFAKTKAARAPLSSGFESLCVGCLSLAHESSRRMAADSIHVHGWHSGPPPFVKVYDYTGSQTSRDWAGRQRRQRKGHARPLGSTGQLPGHGWRKWVGASVLRGQTRTGSLTYFEERSQIRSVEIEGINTKLTRKLVSEHSRRCIVIA